MTTISTIITLLAPIAFIGAVGMHLVRKSGTLIGLYALQSFALAAFLALLAIEAHDTILMITALLTLIIKVVIAPRFFYRLITRSKAYFTAGTYVGIPLTLLILLCFMFFTAKVVVPFGSILDIGLLPLADYALLAAGMPIALFLIVNHRDIIAQIIGILAFENWIVFGAAAVGIKQTLTLELGMSFVIAIWIIIAIMFTAMLHRDFGAFNLAKLNQLKED